MTKKTKNGVFWTTSTPAVGKGSCKCNQPFDRQQESSVIRILIVYCLQKQRCSTPTIVLKHLKRAFICLPPYQQAIDFLSCVNKSDPDTCQFFKSQNLFWWCDTFATLSSYGSETYSSRWRDQEGR